MKKLTTFCLFAFGIMQIGNAATAGMPPKPHAVYAEAEEAEVLTPPYAQSFDTQGAFDTFTNINANGDTGKKNGAVWSWYESGKVARYKYHKSNDADDWLITPGLKLESGKAYKVTFRAYSSGTEYTESLEVKYGNAPTVEGQSETLMPKTNVTPDEAKVYESEIVSKADQTVYIGFHAVSPSGQFFLYLDDIKVEEGVSAAKPDSVTALAVEPDPAGNLKATVSFNAPAKNIDGSALTEISKIELKRDGALVKAFENVAAGQKLSFTDEDVKTKGFHTYAATPYAGEAVGTTAEAKAFIGKDIPQRPTNVKIADNQTSLRISWDKAPSKGKNGGVVIPEEVEYQVFKFRIEGSTTYYIPLGTTKDNFYDVEMNTEEGGQQALQYAVSAFNEEGKSDTLVTDGVTVGKTYALPFNDSFSGGSPQRFWTIKMDGYKSFEPVTEEENVADGDGGALKFNSFFDDDAAWLTTGKISFAGAEHPTVRFSHKADPGTQMKLEVLAMSQDGDQQVLKTINYADSTANAHWTEEKLAIDPRFGQKPYAFVSFHVMASKDYQTIYLDNVKISDLYEYNLSIGMDAPKKAEKGKEAKVEVTIKNDGEKDVASGYRVALTANGKTVATEYVEKTLAADSDTTFEMAYTPSVLDGDEQTLTASVTNEYDMKLSDNSVSQVVALLGSGLNAPQNVTVENTAEGNILKWEAPSDEPRAISDDAEKYTPWLTQDFGSWTTVDGDGGDCMPLFSNVRYPNQGKPFSFTVFNPEDMYPGLAKEIPALAPHSGNQYFAAVYSGFDENSQVYYDADNWLISPTLPGTAQMLTFYVSNFANAQDGYAETFDVLYSTSADDLAIGNFVKIGDTHSVSGEAWQKVEVGLPNGAQRFAIHHNTPKKESFLFMVDDLEFTAKAETPTGYNIYRDGEIIRRLYASTDSFADIDVHDGEHDYAVSATYTEGESAATEASVETGISSSNLQEEKKPMNIYSVDGRIIATGRTSLKGLKPGVYVVGGKKIVVK